MDKIKLCFVEVLSYEIFLDIDVMKIYQLKHEVLVNIDDEEIYNDLL